MAEAVLKTGNAVLSDTYAQKAAQRLGVSTESVRKEFQKTSPAKTAHAETPEEEEPSVAPDQPPPSERELWLLKFILLSDEQAEWIAAHLDLNWVQNSTVREIIAARLKAKADQSWNGIPALLSHFEDGAIRSLITQAVSANVSSENLSHKIADTARLLRNDFIDRQLVTLTRRLAEPTLTQADLIEIEKEKARLRQEKRQPLSPPPG